MKKRTKRLLGGLTLAAGAAGAAGAFLAKKKNMRGKRISSTNLNVWARPGMTVIFRAELMPGRDRERRSFKVKELLPSGRVVLNGVAGEHAEKEFERIE